MCDPVTLTAVAVGSTLASTAVTFDQQRKQGKFQQATARYNARVAENQAEKTINAGVERENEQRRRTAQLISRQRAQLGAASVDLGSGSALQIQDDAAFQGEVDALRIRNNTLDQADSLQTGAELTRIEGDNARSAGNTAAVGTLFSGAGRVAGQGLADKWFQPNSAAVSGDIPTGVV